MTESRKKPAGGAQPSNAGAPPWWVHLHDPEPARCDELKCMVQALGAIAVELGNDRVLTATLPHVALVAVPAELPAMESALRVIQQYRAAGIHVLAYAEGAGQWSVARKCRPLIAGAAQLVDADSRTFAASMREMLARVFAMLATRLAEDAMLRDRMRALGVAGDSRCMREVYRQVLRYAALSDLPVLVTGETGTGKERITRALHQCDPKRSRHPFVAVNCGALVSSLAESELFGHRRGAFTGADGARPGLVRSADRGVLFLDEIGELDLALQTKLLRVLQEGSVLGVGEEREVPVDVRVVAATHRDLAALVTAGRFRADLLHRLHVLPLALPPLRERREDIPVLIRHFLGRQQPGPGREQPLLANDLLEALAELPLPGNVRQLENLLRQMLANKREPGPLLLSDLPAAVLGELAGQLGVKLESQLAVAPGGQAMAPALKAIIGELAEVNDWKLARCLDACECEVVAAALKRVAGNQTRAAGLLGITTRCVYNKIRKFGLSA